MKQQATQSVMVDKRQNYYSDKSTNDAITIGKIGPHNKNPIAHCESVRVRING